jgi:hypothetical protein
MSTHGLLIQWLDFYSAYSLYQQFMCRHVAPQHSKLDFYSAYSLYQQSMCRHVAPQHTKLDFYSAYSLYQQSMCIHVYKILTSCVEESHVYIWTVDTVSKH